MNMIKKQTRNIIAVMLAIALIFQLAPNVVCQAAEAAWKVVVNPKTPLDEVYFYAEDKDSDKKYFYGYINGRIAVMDSDYNLVKETDFTTFLTKDYVKVKNQNGVVVRNRDKCGVISAAGETLIEYDSLRCYNGGSYIYAEKEMNGKREYALLDTHGEELIGFGEYEELSVPRFSGEHYVIGGYDGNDTVSVIFDGKVISQKKTSGEYKNRFSCYFRSSKNQDCIVTGVWENDAEIYHFMDCKGTEICAYKTKRSDDEREYVLLGADGEAIAEVDEYKRRPKLDFKDGHYVVSGHYGGNTVKVLLDGKVIFEKSVENGDIYDECSFRSRNNQEYIWLNIDEEVNYYIDYEGNEVFPYQMPEWLNEKQKADEEYAGTFFDEVVAGEVISELESKTAYTDITKDSGKVECYYWTEVKAKLSYKDKYGDDTYTNMFYSSIYDENGRRIVSGRSFSGYDCIDDSGWHEYSPKESYYILTDEGKLCYFDRDTGAVTELFVIDDSEKAVLNGGSGSGSYMYNTHVLEIEDKSDKSYEEKFIIQERWKEKEERKLYILSSKETFTYDRRINDFYIVKNQENKADVFYLEETKLKKCGTLDMSLEQLNNAEWEDSSRETKVILDKDNHFVYILSPDRIIKNSYEEMGFGEDVRIYDRDCADNYISVLFKENSKYIWLTVNIEDASRYSVILDEKDKNEVGRVKSVLETEDSVYWCTGNSVISIDKDALGYSVKKYDDIFGKRVTISDTEESEMSLNSVFVFHGKVYLKYNLEYRYDIVRHEDGNGMSYSSCDITGVMDWEGRQCIDASDFIQEKESSKYFFVAGEHLFYNNRVYNSEFDIIETDCYVDKENSYDTEGQRDKTFISLRGKNTLFLVDEDNKTFIAEIDGSCYLTNNYYDDRYNRGILQYGDYSILQVHKILYDEETEKYLGTKTVNLIYDKSQRKLVYNNDVESYVWADVDKKEVVVFEKKEGTGQKPTAAPASASPSDTPSVPSNAPSAPPSGGNNFPIIVPTPAPTLMPTPTAVPDESAGPKPSAKPTKEPESSPIPSQTPLETQEPGDSPAPSQTPAETKEPMASETPVPKQPGRNKAIKKGQRMVVKGAKYKIEKTGQNRVVEYLKPVSGGKTAVTVPATVKIKGNTYKVTSVGNGAFKNNRRIKSVKIGKNVRTIGRQAFSGCKKLAKVEMGKNVSIIRDNAFSKCSGLTMITIPEKVDKIGDRAFSQCRKLQYILVKTKKLTQNNVGNKVFSGGYYAPRVKTDKSVWKKYSAIFMSKGMAGKALFVIDPVELVI